MKEWVRAYFDNDKTEPGLTHDRLKYCEILRRYYLEFDILTLVTEDSEPNTSDEGIEFEFWMAMLNVSPFHDSRLTKRNNSREEGLVYVKCSSLTVWQVILETDDWEVLIDKYKSLTEFIIFYSNSATPLYALPQFEE